MWMNGWEVYMVMALWFLVDLAEGCGLILSLIIKHLSQIYFSTYYKESYWEHGSTLQISSSWEAWEMTFQWYQKYSFPQRFLLHEHYVLCTWSFPSLSSLCWFYVLTSGTASSYLFVLVLFRISLLKNTLFFSLPLPLLVFILARALSLK